jgi:hypothetical protein
MKKLIITSLLIITAMLPISAQTVQVEQTFVDAANTAFKEVVALRSAVDALGKANTANANAVEAYKQVNDLLKADNADLRKLKCDSSSILFVIRWKQCR